MADQYRTSRVIIQNTLDSVEPVILYLRGVAALLGLDDREIHRICYAVEETLENSILFDFEPDETEEIEIRISRVAAGLQVVISDHGIPRNPFAAPPRSLDEIAADISFDTIAESDGDRISALSSFVIHKLLDRYTQLNRGKEGRSVEMVIFGAKGRISEETARHDTDHPADGKKKFSLIRSATDSDIIGISRLFYKSYGYSYVNDIVYYPERLTQAVASGMLRSSVAVSATGEIIGHLALMEPCEGARITEWGMAICDPACRGQGIMTALVEKIMRDPCLSRYRGMFSHSVTNHAFTQKICAAHGFSDVALLVGYAGADLSFRKIHRRLRQRESTIISYKPLTTLKTPRLFLPARHREIITRLYRGIGIEIEETRDAPADEPPVTRLRDTIVSSINIGEIVLEQAGEDAGKIIAEATRKNCLARVDVIYLILDLEDPRAPATVAACEEKGYIFAGIFPGYHHDQALVMQYFNNLCFDYSLIITCSPLAGELKRYIEQCVASG